MAVQLVIDDGSPWYLSPDIWVVPGDDPDAAPGQPLLGQSAYVWARVHNRGTTAVSGATVRFYWGNPATVLTPSTVTLVGTSFVSLAPNETREVLCVSQWVPSWVNDGHECLIATVSASSDPMSPMGPNDPFSPAADRHQAQRNLNILMAAKAFAVMPFAIFNAVHFRAEEIILEARRAELGILKGQPGFENFEFREMDEIAFGIAQGPRGEGQESVGEQKLAVGLRPGAGDVYRLSARVRGGGAALVLVEQFVGDELVGGLGVVLTADREDDRREQK